MEIKLLRLLLTRKVEFDKKTSCSPAFAHNKRNYLEEQNKTYGVNN